MDWINQVYYVILNTLNKINIQIMSKVIQIKTSNKVVIMIQILLFKAVEQI